MTKTTIKELQNLPIRELTQMCMQHNIAVGLVQGGTIKGLYPLVDIKPTESFDHCEYLDVERFD